MASTAPTCGLTAVQSISPVQLAADLEAAETRHPTVSPIQCSAEVLAQQAAACHLTLEKAEPERPHSDTVLKLPTANRSELGLQATAVTTWSWGAL